VTLPPGIGAWRDHCRAACVLGGADVTRSNGKWRGEGARRESPETPESVDWSRHYHLISLTELASPLTLVTCL
jgi:hypothetical protein